MARYVLLVSGLALGVAGQKLVDVASEKRHSAQLRLDCPYI